MGWMVTWSKTNNSKAEKCNYYQLQKNQYHWRNELLDSSSLYKYWNDSLMKCLCAPSSLSIHKHTNSHYKLQEGSPHVVLRTNNRKINHGLRKPLLNDDYKKIPSLQSSLRLPHGTIGLKLRWPGQR